MKTKVPKYINLVSNPTIFVWLLIYYSPDQSVVLVTRLQKSFFLFIKEFIKTVFNDGKQINLFEENFFEGNNFGPFSKDIAKSITELEIQNKIEIKNKMGYKDQEIISNDLTNNFFDEDNYSDGIYTKNYKIFSLVNSPDNDLTISKIKQIFSESNGNFDYFIEEFKLFCEKMCNTNINNILRYVYQKYPNYIEKSIIKDSVLSENVDE